MFELKKGDKVVTIGGIHGVVASTKEKTVIVKVDDSTKIEFSRSAISGVEVDKPAKAESSAKAEKTEKSETTEAADTAEKASEEK